MSVFLKPRRLYRARRVQAQEPGSNGLNINSRRRTYLVRTWRPRVSRCHDSWRGGKRKRSHDNFEGKRLNSPKRYHDRLKGEYLFQLTQPVTACPKVRRIPQHGENRHGTVFTRSAPDGKVQSNDERNDISQMASLSGPDQKEHSYVGQSRFP
jgi:hypothetical protein